MNIIRKYGKSGPYPLKALKVLKRFMLKSKTKKEVIAKRKSIRQSS
jgi:hypothetical protein